MSAVRKRSSPAADLRIAERRSKVVELVSQATPYRQVAEIVGVSLTQVHRDLAAHFEETRPDEGTTGRLRSLMDAEYAVLRRRCYALLVGAEDTQTELAIIDRISKISEHRRRLHGMDAPVGVEVSTRPGTAEWFAEIFYADDVVDVVAAEDPSPAELEAGGDDA